MSSESEGTVDSSFEGSEETQAELMQPGYDDPKCDPYRWQKSSDVLHF